MANCHIPHAESLCLIILDGWGIASIGSGNAISMAKKKNYDSIIEKSLYTELNASGLHVGLPEGLMGNSEVGHLNIGAGRVIYQDIVRIDKLIANTGFHQLKLIKDRIGIGTRVHLIGLVSDGGVHSHLRHLISLISSCLHLEAQLFIHAITDGRDCSPNSAIGFLKELCTLCTNYRKEEKKVFISTIFGRFWAMDRDTRIDRTRLAIDYLIKPTITPDFCIENELFTFLESKYKNGESDEFIKPFYLGNNRECIKQSRIQNDDVIIFFNFRADRMRQLVKGLIELFPVDTSKNWLSMTKYFDGQPFPEIIPPQFVKNTLTEWLSSFDPPFYQARIAETEKYAHVTFFFNGGKEISFTNEHRFLIPSPRNVKTYDLKPEMSVIEVANAVSNQIELSKMKNMRTFIMCNLAPPDMVGHTGNISATRLAIEYSDQAIGIIKNACEANGFALVITADHGNAEQMLDDRGNQCTSHSCNPVPFIVFYPNAPIDNTFYNTKKCIKKGSLCDVAPTILEILNLPIPDEMTGRSLFSLI